MTSLKGKEYRRFEDIKHVREDGSEFWSARELAPVLEYNQWRNFNNVINRAMIACENSGHTVSDDFAEGVEFYSNYKKSARQDFSLCIVEGEGVELEGTRWWFDKAGKPYSLQDIAALPMHRMALGNCAAAARPSCDYFAEGCCDPAKCMAVVCHAAGVTMPIMSPQNKGLVPTVTGMLGSRILLYRQPVEGCCWSGCTKHEYHVRH